MTRRPPRFTRTYTLFPYTTLFRSALGFGLAGATSPDVDESGSDPRVDALVAEREAARAAKDFATSDRIRDELAAEGIDLVDTPQGPTWRRRGQIGRAHV